jgi:hypothetical protein
MQVVHYYKSVNWAICAFFHADPEKWSKTVNVSTEYMEEIVSHIFTLKSLIYKHTFHFISNIMNIKKQITYEKWQTDSMFYTYNM